MRKLRDDSTWNQLTSEQRERLEDWLFEENLGYAGAVGRVKKKFGLEATIASIGRFYRRRARERQTLELFEAGIAAAELNDLPVSVKSLRLAAIKLAGKAALRVASEKPERSEDLQSLAKLLLLSEDVDIRQRRLELAERWFHFEATAAARKDLPRLTAYLSVISDDTALSNEEKVSKVRDIMFPDSPKLSVDQIKQFEAESGSSKHG